MSLLLSSFYPIANAVLTTGNQTISGIKTFNERIIAPEIRGSGLAGSNRKIDLQQGQLYAGTSTISLDYWNRILSGNWRFQNRPTVSGIGVLLQGEAAGGGGTLENAVYITGSQTITGPKNFTARPTLSGLNLITTGDLVNLELNIEGALASSSAFDGNRPIKRVPSLSDPQPYGGTTISGFLENMFFPYINRSLTQTAFPIFPYGYSGFNSINFNGNIASGDDIQTGIAYVEGVTIRSGPVSILNSALTYSSVTPVPLSATISATTAENYRTRLYVTRNNIPNTIIQSTNPLRIRFEPPYFYGVSNNINLGVGVTGLLRVDPSTYLNINGSNYSLNSRPSFITLNGTQGLPFTLSSPGYIYFACPNFTNATDSITSWGSLANTAGVVDTTSLFDYTSQFVANTSTVNINFPTRSNLIYRIYRSDLITPITSTTLNLRFTFQ